MGLGMIVMYVGYAILFWTIQAFQGNSQDSFTSYLLPFAPKNPGVATLGSLGGGSNSTPAPTPADTKAASKATPAPPTTKAPGSGPGGGGPNA